MKSGGATPPNVEIDITAAVTPADVATAIAAALAAYTASLALPPAGGGPGFSSSVAAGIVSIIQAFPHKNQPRVAHVSPNRLTWFGKTTGALGNVAIVPSVPGEWTGRIRGMAGGKPRRAGLYSRPIPGARFQCLNAFVPAIVAPEPPG